ncbi:MAG: DUF4167 domain-containing protein [Candidatus Saccharibacteria bacterium]|nr:DUF4167 domain-containing protein [Pseudorhodobacter sp.]
MRSSKSRSRSKTNRPRTLGNIINRVFDSSGPEGKVRGTPAQLIEKYQFLARDAQLSNDRVAAENFLQHAEHYTRLLAEANREMAAEQDSRPAYQQPNNGGQNGQNAQNGQNGQNQPRDRQQNDRQQNDRPQYDRSQNERPQNDRPQNDRSQNDRPQNDRPQNDRPQNDRPQNDRSQNDRPQNDRQDYREQRPDYRAEQRSDYRNDVADEQPVIAAHDMVDLVGYDDAGLVETPEAAPKPRNDEPRRNDRPRYDRTRDENRRTYPPRVDQPQTDRPAESRVQIEAKPEASLPAPDREPMIEPARKLAAQAHSPKPQPAPPSMMPQMPLFDAPEAAKPAAKPRAKPAAAKPATTEAAASPQATDAPSKPRLAPRPRAPKKPVDDFAGKSDPTEIVSD